MISIGAVSRQTGITAETLRKWEQRYGFPVPERSASGHRQFREPDVQALLLVVRRLSTGERPGKAITAVQEALCQTQRQAKPGYHPLPNGIVARALAYLAEGDWAAFELFIESRLLEYGIRTFTLEIAFPLMEAVGLQWQQGTLPIYAEHAFSSALLRVVFRHLKPAEVQTAHAHPVLFSSPAGEMHTLALTLGNALFCNEGIPNVLLIGGLPTAEIAAAAISYGARVVALSASVSYPPRLLKSELHALRKLLPPTVAIWLGGSGANRIAGSVAGIDILTSWDAAIEKYQGYSCAARQKGMHD